MNYVKNKASDSCLKNKKLASTPIMCCLESLFLFMWFPWCLACLVLYLFCVWKPCTSSPYESKVEGELMGWSSTKCQSNLPNKNLFWGKILLLILSFCVLHEYFLFSATYGALPVQSCNFDLFGILTLSWWYIMHVDGI